MAIWEFNRRAKELFVMKNNQTGEETLAKREELCSECSEKYPIIKGKYGQYCEDCAKHMASYEHYFDQIEGAKNGKNS